ncbi:hypothetical protein KFE25_004184 [Diacronema lutheri]|uniref:Uncharacterized protein n=1 Tax=Diacronema lutheri TaxID=2081491 RepID=A0A8J5X1T5_DIALT|nr:hypothetical protein KFE25_004184 [Diacronema lutheri]
MLAVVVHALLAFSSPKLARPSGARQSVVVMAQKKVLKLDARGEFQAREVSASVPRVNLLRRIDELKLLTQVANAGLLSQAESAGLFSKLESAGAFSTVEKLLPAADDFGLLGAAEALVNTPVTLLLFGIAGLVGAEAVIVTLVPDDNAALLAVQIATGVAAGAGAVALAAAAFLVSVVQGE